MTSTTTEIKSKNVYSVSYLEQVRAEHDKVFNYIKPELQELSEYFMPRSARFYADEKDKKRKKINKIKDSTPLRAVRNYSSGLMTAASSPASSWFTAKIKNYTSKNHDVLSWCAYITELFNCILSSSNFYQIIPLCYRHLGVYGFGAIYGEYDYDTVANFKLIPMGSYRYSRNAQGQPDTFIRVYKESVRNIVDQFGIENISEQIKKDFDNKRFNEQYEICHFVAPNKEYMPNAVWAKNKKFVSIYYEIGTSNNKSDKFLSKSGYNRFPYFIYESECTGTDTYPSISSGIEAIPDTRQLMEMIEDEAKGIKKIYSPACKGPANLKSKLTDKAGGYVAIPENAKETIQPINQVPAQFMSIHDLIEIKKTDIENAFFNDLFSIILNTQKGDRTAFEVNELKEEKLSLLAPLLNQVYSGHKNLMEWIFELACEVGICPEPPEDILDKELDIEFCSTLTRARLASKISGLERFSTYILNVASQVNPAYVQKFKWLESVDKYAEFGNIDSSLLNSNEEVENIIKAQAQAQEQQTQQAQLMQAMKDGSEIVKNIGGQDSSGADLLQRFGV